VDESVKYLDEKPEQTAINFSANKRLKRV